MANDHEVAPDDSTPGGLPSQIMQAIRKIGWAYDGTGNRLGIALKVYLDHGRRIAVLPISLTAPRNGAALIEWSLNNDLDVLANSDIKNLGRALRDAAGTKRIVILTRGGYHKLFVEGIAAIVYAWGNRVYFFGPKPGFKVRMSDHAQATLLAAGDATSWIAEIAPIAKKNPRLLLALCICLSAALRRALGRKPLALILYGYTSIGKSTIQAVCASMTGSPEFESWNGTLLGIQDLLIGSPDQPICLDDAHKADKASHLSQILMAAGSGASRATAQRTVAKAPAMSVESTPILSSEKDLASMPDRDAAAGVYARVHEVGAGKVGMFDDLCGFDSGAALADHLKEFVRKQHGTVWPHWLSLLEGSWDTVEESFKEDLPRMRDLIWLSAGEPALDSLTNRVLDGLAFAAFAGGLARKLRLWSFSDRRIAEAFALTLKERIKRTPSGNPFLVRAAETIGGYIEANRGKFLNASGISSAEGSGHIGYRVETEKYGTLYLFIPKSFQNLFGEELGSEVFPALRAGGHLVSHKGKNNRYAYRVPSETDGEDRVMNFIAIKDSIRFDRGND